MGELKLTLERAQQAVASKIIKLDRRIGQLEHFLTGDASHDARIHKKIHTLRKELCILDPSRKKPDCWTLTFEVQKFARQLKSRAMASKSYLSSMLCCKSNVHSEISDDELSRRLSELSD